VNLDAAVRPGPTLDVLADGVNLDDLTFDVADELPFDACSPSPPATARRDPRRAPNAL